MLARGTACVNGTPAVCHHQRMAKPVKVAMELRPAGPFARALALAIDEVFRWMLIALGLYALDAIGALNIGASVATIVFVYWSYGVMFDVLAGGQTPGKRAQRIGVVNADGTPVHLGASSIRNVLLLVDALPFAYLVGLVTMMLTRRFRRVGDVVAGTLVVYREPACEPWEAADRGCMIVRRAPQTLYGAWIVTAVPVFALMVVALWSYPGTAGFLLWWLKPLYERMPMWIVRQRKHDRMPKVLEIVADWRRFSVGLPAMLTYRRLSPTRSFDVSVDVLEGVAGSRRRARVALLHQCSGSPALWLTVICAHVEAFLVTAATIVLLWQAPRHSDLDLMSLMSWVGSNQFGWTSNVVYLIVIGLVGPVYAAAGLTLYENRRRELEGDDAPFPRHAAPTPENAEVNRRTID